MRYVQINSVPHGSTGSVMQVVHERNLAKGHESWMMWGRGRSAQCSDEYKFGSRLGFYADAVRSLVDDRAGFHSRAATRRLLRKLDEIDPDIVHLHNLHGYYVHIEMLFGWLANHRCKVKWTLHDCWAITGHCAHFTYAGCTQWKRCGCSERPCPQRKEYPVSMCADAAGRNFADKRQLFTLLPSDRMTIITPSKWLADLVGESYLSKYPVEVVHNEIDTTVFKPTPSDFRRRHGLQGRFIVLGVASPWTKRKGLEDFLWLADHLDARFVFVLVGMSRRQARQLGRRFPRNMFLPIRKTRSKMWLAELYTSADILLQPSIEETFGLTILEAYCCGTPSLVYKGGACAETAGYCGGVSVCEREGMRDALLSAAMEKPSGLTR